MRSLSRHENRGASAAFAAAQNPKGGAEAPPGFVISNQFRSSGRLLLLNEFPRASGRVDRLDIDDITDRITIFSKCDATGRAVTRDIGQRFHDLGRVGRAGGLERLERDVVSVIAHGRHSRDGIITAVGGLGIGIAVDIGFDRVVKLFIAAFNIERGNTDFVLRSVRCIQDHVVIPGVRSENGDVYIQRIRLRNDLRGISNSHRREEHAAALILGLVQVGAEVGVVLREGVGDDGAAGLFKRLLEISNQSLVILVAVLTEAVGLLGSQLGCIVCKNRALERIGVANAEVVAVAGRDVRVRARHTDGRDAGLLERVGRSHRHTGTIGTKHDRNLLVDELGSRRDSLGGIGTVVGVDELDLVGLAADLDGRGLLIGILHAEHFLLAAGAGVAAGGLEHANLHDLLPVVGRALVPAAAGAQREHHDQSEQQSNRFFHCISSNHFFSGRCPQRADKCPSNEYDGIILSFCKKCNINFTKYSYQNFE